MTIKILEKPAINVVGMAIRTRPMSPEIPALWPKFAVRIDEIADTAEPNVSYGVMRHDPGPPEALLYMAAVSVKKPGPVPNGMESLAVPAGTYASFTYALADLGKGFGEIFNRMLPASGYVPTAAASFERYDEKFNPQDRQSAVEILIPVRRR
jgi:AraC family transcriptional regulator